MRVYKITTASGVVTAVEDHRAGPGGVHGGAGGGGGDVGGPGSSTDGDFAQFDGGDGALLKGGISLDTDISLAANSDTRLASQKAVKTYVDAATGGGGARPLQMTKWLDTNYHHLVPEIGPRTAFAADPVIGLITKTETNPFFVKMKEGAEQAAKDYKVKVTFAKGAALPDPEHVFNASLTAGTRRAVDVGEGDVLNVDAFVGLIRAAVALNESKG